MIDGATIRKGYADSSFGQLHWRSAGKGDGAPDLYCLHPAPFSGLAYTGIMPHLANGRHVIAPDYPGHGGSDSFRSDASIADYAKAMAELIDALSDGGPIDLIGFHTGCLVAGELSLIAPGKMRRLIFIDVPAFEPAIRAKLLGSMGGEFAITADMECLDGAWDLGMTKRIESQGLDRSFAMFVEQLRHGKGRNAAFHAGFSYDVEARLAKIVHPVTIIATQSGLIEASRRAADLIPHADYIERPDIKRAVLDEAAEKIAAIIVQKLDKGD